MKVKLLEATDKQELQDAINVFLLNHKVVNADISYQVVWSTTGYRLYCAMVVLH